MKRTRQPAAIEPTQQEIDEAADKARKGDPSALIALGMNPYAARLLDPAYRARRDREQAERSKAWDTTPQKLFGRDSDAHTRAEAAGWKFERGERGHHGNLPPFYAISPTGYRYRWNGCMMYGGADPWEPIGQDEEGSVAPAGNFA